MTPNLLTLAWTIVGLLAVANALLLAILIRDSTSACESAPESARPRPPVHPRG